MNVNKMIEFSQVCVFLVMLSGSVMAEDIYEFPQIMVRPDVSQIKGISTDEFKAMGAPLPSQTTLLANISSSSLGNFMTYGQKSGATAIDLGLVSGGMGSSNAYLAARSCRGCFTNFNNHPLVSSTKQALAKGFEDSVNKKLAGFSSLLNGLNAVMPGRSHNLFSGPAQLPGGNSFDFNVTANQLFSGGYSNQTLSRPNNLSSVFTVLNMNPSSPYNFGSQFTSNVNNYFSSPWARHNVFRSFRGFSVFQANNALPIVAEERENYSFESLTERYQALNRHQLQAYYVDNQLSLLRAEANKVYMLAVMKDPWYLYYSYELQNGTAQIQVTRPSYLNTVNVASAVASWTLPPQDNAQLMARYQTRQVLQQLYAQLNFETAITIAANPPTQQFVSNASQFIFQLMDAAWKTNEMTTWFNDWQARWDVAVTHAEGSVRIELNQILEDFPAFKEYLEIKNAVVEKVPSLSGMSEVKLLESAVSDVGFDSSAIAEVEQLYANYNSALSQQLQNTTVTAEQERYLERLNGLILNDPVYTLMVSTQYLALSLLNNYVKAVHDAVANCLFLLGSFCNPYIDPNTQAITQSVNALQTISNAGDFYELHNKYWYLFYNSEAYKQLEAETTANMQSILTPARAIIDQERSKFMAEVEEIAKIKQFRAVQESALLAVNDQPVNVASGFSSNVSNDSQAATTVSPTIGSSLDRISQLLTVLSEGKGGDADKDVVFEAEDNCSALANPNQIDSDNDNIGNMCDCDFNQDNFCGGPDFSLLVACFNMQVQGNENCAAPDMDGNGTVDNSDYNLFIAGFNQQPGPSGKLD